MSDVHCSTRLVGPAFAVTLAVGAALLLPAPAVAATEAGAVTQFSAGISASSNPLGITAGPDGNLWFTENSGHRIGRITPTGAVTEFSSGPSSDMRPRYITAGPDGNLWFTTTDMGGQGLIARITPAGAVTEFTSGISPNNGLGEIAAGPDGNLWFTESAGRIGRITPSGTVTEFSAGITPGSSPTGITAGPDGNLWFTEFQGNRVGRITPSGTVTEFTDGITAGSNPRSITTGPDGNLWFTSGSANRIARITPTGTVTEFTEGITGGSLTGWYLSGITTGIDGNLWYARMSGGIGRITTTGDVTQFFAGIEPFAALYDIAAGPDGNLWFAQWQTNQIGRISSGVDPAVANPVLAGSGQVGLPLVCTNAIWPDIPWEVWVGWRRDGTEMPGQAGPSYTPTTGDVGHAIACAQSAWLPGDLTPWTATSNAVTVIPAPVGPSGPTGPAGPAGPVGPAGPAGPAPLVAVFAPTTLKARTGARIRIVYALSARARVTLRLVRRGVVVSAVVPSRAGTNSVLFTLKRGRTLLPTGTYSLALRTSSGRTLTTTRVIVVR